MPLENVRTIEAFLRRRSGPRAKPAHHRAFVVGQCVAILVVFSCKALLMIFACHDRALLWSFGLMRQHVRFQILKKPTTVGIGASTPFLAVFIKAKTCGASVFL